MTANIIVWESPSGRFHRGRTCDGRNSKLFVRKSVSESEILDKGFQGNCQCMKLTLLRLDKRTWQERATDGKV